MSCKAKNQSRCNCTATGCSKKYNCCDCLAYHLRNRGLPACCFPKDAEATYDRSFEYFAKLVNQNQV